MLPSASSLYGEGEAFVFQQDNAPCHKPNKVTRFLERAHVEVLHWPAQTLNHIEHLWEVIFRKVERSKPGSLEALWQLHVRPSQWTLSKTWYAQCRGDVLQGLMPRDTAQNIGVVCT